MVNLKDKNVPILLVEVLILQRFPFGQDSTFLYFANRKNLNLSVGDIVATPFRNSIKNGVVVSAFQVRTNQNPGSSWQVNVNALTAGKNLFYSSPPNKPIVLKPVKSLIIKGFLSPNLLDNFRLAAKEHCVSWNHFVSSAVNLPPIRKTAFPKLLPMLGRWCQVIENPTGKLDEASTFPLNNTRGRFIFASQDQSKQISALLQKTILEKKQILVLVPEKINLLPVTAKYTRLSANFANATPVILGKFLPRNAYQVAWQLTRTVAPQIFIGTRSAIFAPFSKLGLIIIEDGHDASHKQWDMAPLYDVRNIIPAIYPQVTKLYISATPRLHDFYWSPYYLKSGGAIPAIATFDFSPSRIQPKILSQDLKEDSPHFLKKSFEHEKERKQVTLVNMSKDRGFTKEPVALSDYLKKQIAKVLKRGRWAIIVANHKGFANFIVCKECGFIPICPNCGKYLNIRIKSALRCSYCGKNSPALNQCPQCSGYNFVLSNFGLENIKEKLLELQKRINFKLLIPPDPKLGSRSLYSFWQELITFQNKPAVLLGLSGILPLARLLKKNISLAASTSFDNLLLHPDYRSEEKAAILYYNLLSVADKIIIQTRDPAQNFWSKVLGKPYSALFPGWIRDRKEYNYPPFCDLIRLELTAFGKKHQEVISQRLERFLSQDQAVIETLAIPPKTDMSNSNFTASALVKLQKNTTVGSLLEKISREFGRLKVDPDPEVII